MPQGVLKAVWAHMVIQRYKAAIPGAIVFPPYPLHLPRRNKSRAAWVRRSTDCTYTSTYRSLRRTERKRSSGLSSTQGGCYWHTGNIAQACPYRYVENTTWQSAGNWCIVKFWGGSEGGGRGHLKPHYASKDSTALETQNYMQPQTTCTRNLCLHKHKGHSLSS